MPRYIPFYPTVFLLHFCWSNHAKSLNLTFLLVKSTTTVSSCWWNPSLLLVNFTCLPLQSQVLMFQSWFLLVQSPFLLLQSFKNCAFGGEVVASKNSACEKAPEGEAIAGPEPYENTKKLLGGTQNDQNHRIFDRSMDWFKGTFTGNHGFYHWIWGFPVKFPLNQSIE